MFREIYKRKVYKFHLTLDGGQGVHFEDVIRKRPKISLNIKMPQCRDHAEKCKQKVLEYSAHNKFRLYSRIIHPTTQAAQFLPPNYPSTGIERRCWQPVLKMYDMVYK